MFEGPPEAVDSLVRFSQSGPRTADVDRVEVSEEEPEGVGGFQIR